MPTKEQLEKALQGAHNAGDTAAAKQLANSIKSGDYQGASKAKTLGEKRAYIGGGSLQFGPWDTGIATPQWLDEGLAGVGRRMSQIGTLGTHKGDPLANALLDDSIPATVGSVVTDIGAMAAGGAGLKSMQAVPKIGGTMQAAGQSLMAPKSLAGGITAAGTYGAATTPDRLTGGVGGAVGQGIGYGVPKLAGKVVSPKIKEVAKTLMKRGGTVTPGEAFGGSIQTTEDALTSMPLLGDTIKAAKTRSLKAYNKGLINDALEGVGKKVDDRLPAGRDAIAQADAIISDGYNETLKRMNVKVDQEFAGELDNLLTMAKELPEREYRKFQQIVNKNIYEPFDNPNQLQLGETFKQSASDIRSQYQGMAKSSDIYVKELGAAVRELHKSVIGMARRQNPSSAEKLASLDVAYAKMSRIAEAASFKGAREGVFTPDHLLNSIKKTASKRQYGKGQVFGQKEAEAAKEILAPTIPDSGTTPRALMNALVLGGTGAINPAVPAGILASAGLYTKPAQKVLPYLLYKRPEIASAARSQIDRLAPLLGIGGAGVGIQRGQ